MAAQKWIRVHKMNVDCVSYIVVNVADQTRLNPFYSLMRNGQKNVKIQDVRVALFPTVICQWTAELNISVSWMNFWRLTVKIQLHEDKSIILTNILHLFKFLARFGKIILENWPIIVEILTVKVKILHCLRRSENFSLFKIFAEYQVFWNCWSCCTDV